MFLLVKALFKHTTRNKRAENRGNQLFGYVEPFPFKNELEQWQQLYSHLKIIYIVTGIEGRLTKEKLQNYIEDIMQPMYYIVGPPGMVDASEKMLKDLGIESNSILTDIFDGY